MTKEEVIEYLRLEPHPTEGGYFRRTYESSSYTNGLNPPRRCLTSIYYMLTSDSPHGYLHRNQSDIVHFHHSGSPIRYLIISPEGQVQEKILGPNLLVGEQPQLTVRGGDWKASQLCSGEYGLISEAVSPGFEYEDNHIASAEELVQLFPDLAQILDQYIKRLT
mgnify:CR=1 FL=1